MLPRFGWAVRLGLVALAVLPLVACQRVPLLAPTGSTITLTTTATALALNGTAPIIAQVIAASGTPPHSGTHITFTTTLGTITPSETETDSAGRAVVTFDAGGSSGTATITAISGGAAVASDKVLKILIGTAAVGRIVLNASPAQVPSVGGSSTIGAQLYDINGNALPGVSVAFSTTAGTLSTQLVVTDRTGAGQVVLSTSTEATVTASVGAAASSGGSGSTTPGATGTATASVTVKVAGAATLTITPPSTLTAGAPGAFQFVVGAAAGGGPVRSVVVNWGDGSPDQNLGAMTGTSSVSHVYAAPGTYNIVGTLTDAFGNVVTVTIPVTVTGKLQPVVSITLNTTNPTSGTDVVFTGSVQPAANSNTVIQSVSVNFGDGTVTPLGAVSGTSISLHHVYQTGGTYTVTLTATDSNGGVGTAVTTVFVQTSVPLGVSLAATTTPSGTNTTVQFTATVFGLGNDVVVNYHWVFGSTLGVADTTTNTVTRTYAAGTGTVTPTVTITTSSGKAASASTVIIIP